MNSLWEDILIKKHDLMSKIWDPKEIGQQFLSGCPQFMGGHVFFMCFFVRLALHQV